MYRGSVCGVGARGLGRRVSIAARPLDGVFHSRILVEVSDGVDRPTSRNQAIERSVHQATY